MAPKNHQRDQALNALAERVFESMLDDLCMDVALQAHRELVLAQRPCPICHTRCGHSLNHAPADDNETPFDASAAEGDGKAGNNIILKCSNCDQKIASNRYAPHLSSCLGLGTSRRGAVRNVASKPSLDAERFPSPALASEASTVSDDARTPKNKAKSKAKRTDDAEFNLHRKRATPQGSPKKSERTRPLASTSISRVPSKLRESSLASFAEPDGDVNMSQASRESSPEDEGLFSSAPPSAVSRSPVVPRKADSTTTKSYASPQTSQASGPLADYLIDEDGDETDSATDSGDSS